MSVLYILHRSKVSYEQEHACSNIANKLEAKDRKDKIKIDSKRSVLIRFHL